jgi:hypothetical protein
MEVVRLGNDAWVLSHVPPLASEIKANLAPAILIAVSLVNVALLVVNAQWARRTSRRSRSVRRAERRLDAGPVTAALDRKFATPAAPVVRGDTGDRDVKV